MIWREYCSNETRQMGMRLSDTPTRTLIEKKNETIRMEIVFCLFLQRRQFISTVEKLHLFVVYVSTAMTTMKKNLEFRRLFHRIFLNKNDRFSK